MASADTSLHRRAFLKTTAGGFTLGGMLGLGLDLRAAQEEARHLKIANVKEVPSVCPYCAVGCGQLVHVRDKRIINIEGNPESPINQGTLCPKGAATYQLAVNPNRVTRVWHRAAGATEWDKTKTLDWAMNRIAQLVKETRDATFRETWSATDRTEPTSPLAERQEGASATPLQEGGGSGRKRVNHTLAIASLGGATMDNEWNYVQAKLMRALGVVCLENQARI
jgi:formate dehydrogenase major subunit